MGDSFSIRAAELRQLRPVAFIAAKTMLARRGHMDDYRGSGKVGDDFTIPGGWFARQRRMPTQK